MSRQIIRAADVAAARSAMGPRRGASRGEETTATAVAVPEADGYFDRLTKLIPGETVALYLTLYGILLSDGPNPTIHWSVVAIALVFNIVYMRRWQKVTRTADTIVIELAVVVWIVTLHGTQLFPSWYQLKFGSALMVIFTAAEPLLIPS
jgi:hypothetical protein